MVLETYKLAILADNPALSTLLCMVLAGDSRLQIRSFADDAALFSHMEAAALDLLITDFDRAGRPAYETVEAIRLNPALVSRDLPVLALTRAITPPMRHQAISAGIDEVLVKPTSPRHLLQRVQARLVNRAVVGMRDTGYRGPERRNRVPLPKPNAHPGRRGTDNVIPLFPDRRQSRHSGREPLI